MLKRYKWTIDNLADSSTSLLFKAQSINDLQSVCRRSSTPIRTIKKIRNNKRINWRSNYKTPICIRGGK